MCVGALVHAIRIASKYTVRPTRATRLRGYGPTRLRFYQMRANGLMARVASNGRSRTNRSVYRAADDASTRNQFFYPFTKEVLLRASLMRIFVF